MAEQIVVPHNFNPYPFMIPVLNDPHRFQVLNWHRKARKTTLAVNQLIRWAATIPAVFWYVGPSYGNAKRVVWDDPQMFSQYIPDWNNPYSTFIKKRETELRVDFLQSGGQLYVYGSDRPDLMRGPNPYGVVLDEYSVQKPEVWNDIVQPVMRSNPQAWCWFLFTPRGKNHAFDVYNFGLRGDNEWKSWTMNVLNSGIYTPEQITNARRDMPANSFNQELMCEFLEGEGSVFRGVKAVCTAEPCKPIVGKYYVMGLDLAKVQDYTVIVIYDRATNRQVYQDRFQTLEWPFQVERIRTIAKHYNNAEVVVDATGVGDPIVDMLSRAGCFVTPVKITNESKKEMIEKMSIWIEQGKMRMLNIPETLIEFDNFAYDISTNGRITYNAREGMHDDIVIAHALAVFALSERTIESRMTEMPPVRKFLQEELINQRRQEDEFYDWEESAE